MYYRNVGVIAVYASSVVAALGCAAGKAGTEGKSDTAAEQRTRDVAFQRSKFTEEARDWLDELDDRIVVLAVKLHDHGDEAQREQWGELLFQLKQERKLLDEELVNARDVPDEAWASRQIDLRQRVRKLETAINRSAVAIIADLSSGPRVAQAEPDGSMDLDLCHVQVNGTNADVLQHGELLIVHLSAAEPGAIEALQMRAEEELLRHASPGPSVAPPDGTPEAARRSGDAGAPPSAAPLYAAQLQVSETPEGVAFIFEPRAGELEALRVQLEQAAERIEERRC